MNQIDLRARFRPSVRSLRSALLLALAAMCFVPHAAAAAVPIKICFVDDRSGAAADTGKFSLEGVELAIDQFNAAGGANGHSVALAIASQPGVLQRLEAGDIAAARQNFRDDAERIGTFEGVQGRKGATYRFTARNHQGPAGDNWYVYAQVTEKGTRLIPANLNTFSPKK